MNKRLYVSLDTLLDTRLGTLFRIDQEAHQFLVNNDYYRDRDYTDWSLLTNGRVSNEVFNEHYAKRDKETLKHSIATGILPLLMQLLVTYDQAMVERITETDLSVEVNIWPYELEVEEVDELTNILKQIFGQSTVVLLSSTPLEELTPRFLVERYAGAVMFDFHEWIKTHTVEFYKLKANRFSLIVPRLFETDPGALSLADKQHELQRFRMIHLEHMDIEFVEARFMSIVKP